MTDCHVSLISAQPIPDDLPVGKCRECGKPYADHEKRVSPLAPPNSIHIWDEKLIRSDADS